MSKRSGDDYTIAGQWHNLDQQGHSGIDDRLKQLITFCSKDEIPDGTAYELRDVVQRLTIAKNDADFEKMQELMRYEVRRVLDRKLRVPRGKLTKKQANLIEQTIYEWLGMQWQPSGEGTIDLAQKQSKKTPIITIEELINEIITAQMLSDVRKLAMIEKEGN